MILYKILPAQCLLLVRSLGEATPEECGRLLKQVRSSHPASREYNSCNDVRELVNFFSFDQANEVVEIMAVESPTTDMRKNALLVQSTAHYGVGRMFEQASQGRIPILTKVVTSFEEAAAWLEVPVQLLVDEFAKADWITVE